MVRWIQRVTSSSTPLLRLLDLAHENDEGDKEARLLGGPRRCRHVPHREPRLQVRRHSFSLPNSRHVIRYGHDPGGGNGLLKHRSRSASSVGDGSVSVYANTQLMRLLLCHVDRLGIVLAAAEFVFTEPHSKHLMLRLRLCGEVLHGSSGVTLEQGHAMEFVVHDRLYDASTPGKRKPISMPLASPVGILGGS
uniref:Uncharacterized protein n=1 Tax=Oryza meridionalis TaxID=40149 RepID=A0A0E0DZM2_9ORYZ